MINSFMSIQNELINKLAVNEIMNCNDITLHYGLILTNSQAKDLVNTREYALITNDRMEFEGGIITKLIVEFCNSPFISQFNYSNTLADLIETFYYYKNETLDEISDDELISLMKEYFNKNCQGSIELLQNRELETLARNIRYGISDYTNLSQDKEYDYNLEDDYE